MKSFEVFSWSRKFSIISKVLFRISTVNFQSHSKLKTICQFEKSWFITFKNKNKISKWWKDIFHSSSKVPWFEMCRWCSVPFQSLLCPFSSTPSSGLTNTVLTTGNNIIKLFLLHGICFGIISYSILNLANILNKIISVWFYAGAWMVFLCRSTLSGYCITPKDKTKLKMFARTKSNVLLY